METDITFQKAIPSCKKGEPLTVQAACVLGTQTENSREVFTKPCQPHTPQELFWVPEPTGGMLASLTF